MDEWKNETTGKAVAVIRRLESMFGEGVRFQAGGELWVHQPTGHAAERYGIRMLFPKADGSLSSYPSAVVYLDEKPDDCPVEELADYAAAQFQAYLKGERPDGTPEFPARRYEYNRAQILENVVLRAVGLRQNEQQLEGLLYCTLLDLAGEYVLYEEGARLEMRLPTSMQDALRITDEELLNAARWNTLSKLGIEMDELSAFARARLHHREWRPQPISEVRIDKSVFYIVSTRVGILGPALLFIPEVLETLGEKAGMDYYVLPIGLDSFLIHRDDGTISRENLRERIREFYEYTIESEPDQVLTDTLYRYSREDRELRIA